MISIVYLCVALACALAAGGDKKNNLWIVHIKGGEEAARGVAQELGLTYKDKGFGYFKDHYAMTREEHPEIDVDDITRGLLDHQNVQWAKQQVISERSMYHLEKREEYESFDDVKEQTHLNWILMTISETTEFKNCKKGTFACSELNPHLLAYLKHLGQTDVEKLGSFSTDPASSDTLSTYKGQTIPRRPNPYKLSAYATRFNDPKWRDQWFVQDYRTTDFPVMDHNVVPVYDMGITGSTVTVGVVGDGVREHPDLGDNYKYDISFDFCDNKKGSTPYQSWFFQKATYDTVGTSSAGVIAMKSNNGLCGVGIAPGATIAGLRVTGCRKSLDILEASALNYNLDIIDIYCNTWTNDDEQGKKLLELSYKVEKALKLGTNEGRKNKGAIYVFPSGANRKNNNCGANGFVNNPYVITIASASSNGQRASYSERCAAVFAAAYSGDTLKYTEAIPTITADGGCSNYASDKPISAAVASGIFALVLQHRPSLTYRDMMHLIAMTAEVAPLANSNFWHRNGRGLWISNDFGFGLLNAKNMITLADKWQTVPDKFICVLNKKPSTLMWFNHRYSQTVTINTSECSLQGVTINYLEHVELSCTIDYTFRGAVHINVTSPAKTNTEVLKARAMDTYRTYSTDWNVMSVHNWGEDPNGLWEVTFMANQINGEYKPGGNIHELTLKLHGTKEMPHHYGEPKKYAAFRLPTGDTN